MPTAWDLSSSLGNIVCKSSWINADDKHEAKSFADLSPIRNLWLDWQWISGCDESAT